ncbi:MAG: hypothetical protein COZ06_30235 [Armatimonadetes bacterium CG_4_10_14_3_um_filter_66_18]|nr:MAG: hypothetical protein AUJ96_01530 [Armatimonadetes bacterium CG2_30_66_41]PIU90532.1 MAG: hypothetical protein COS65_24850 [Armatimonadetes bacterium CG06_land_8_20_14_3_00_66_21]PIX40223.1 MAG: hypothetical protein COZ57_26515 [Armatimonadetes bacterium CG_4_8_14_3_um_filter_66_20]PIY39068.1 MAG: hypothetical protein COZ06_30235 [Armatimonadetes bacterium CG_4_10_14_3_um_filter_66_18]PIZ31927.1 MAG: hypothetical protein COY42_31985 [Armatimonadetes bacterium CG_4_10_14_0_8_um_filter_66_
MNSADRLEDSGHRGCSDWRATPSSGPRSVVGTLALLCFASISLLAEDAARQTAETPAELAAWIRGKLGETSPKATEGQVNAYCAAVQEGLTKSFSEKLDADLAASLQAEMDARWLPPLARAADDDLQWQTATADMRWRISELPKRLGVPAVQRKAFVAQVVDLVDFARPALLERFGKQSLEAIDTELTQMREGLLEDHQHLLVPGLDSPLGEQDATDLKRGFTGVVEASRKWSKVALYGYGSVLGGSSYGSATKPVSQTPQIPSFGIRTCVASLWQGMVDRSEPPRPPELVAFHKQMSERSTERSRQKSRELEQAKLSHTVAGLFGGEWQKVEQMLFLLWPFRSLTEESGSVVPLDPPVRLLQQTLEEAADAKK